MLQQRGNSNRRSLCPQSSAAERHNSPSSRIRLLNFFVSPTAL